ncbi:hypothetical protein [Stenotrophomonas oahuensis]|uniref:Transmembrane protein n=1 Tax=Stenotrophomonas oahuensis TaxID=3003271 RepID=A0ABY9YR48_9GAMM|nr:hypothetical protein [Stenotrophomonas sp. A5586]WNH53413.1 hypothetical protein PDM29_03810 [Stenotrophomonas sp. A5586]
MAAEQERPDAFLQAMEARRKDPSLKGKEGPLDFASRGYGLVALVAALVIFIMDVYLPLTDARAGAERVAYDSKFVFLLPLFLLTGITYTVFGGKTSRVLGPTTRPSLWGWLFVLAGAGAGFAFAHYFESYLRTLGYAI